MMRVLLVGGSPRGDAPLVDELASVADKVVAIDSGGALCAAAGVLPDLVVGDFDSLPKAVSDSLSASGVPFEVHPAEKDETDLDLALAAARRLRFDEIVLTAVLGGRLDHSLGTLGSLVRAADMRPVVFERDISVCVLAASARERLTLSGAGCTFSVMPLGGSARLSIEGVRWPLDGALIEHLSSLGISNVLVDPKAEIVVTSGAAVVLAPRVDLAMAEFEL